MQRILSLMLAISIILGTALPISAFASEAPDTATATQAVEVLEDASANGSSLDSLGESTDTNTLTETDELPFDPIYEATEVGGSSSTTPISALVCEVSEF